MIRYIENKELMVCYQKLPDYWNDSEVRSNLSFLPDLIQQKILPYRNEKDRLLRILGKLMLSKMLHQTGFDHLASLEMLTYTSNNKPILPGVEFSISHSSEFVIVAIGYQKPIGVDIELIKPLDITDYFSFFDNEERSDLNVNTFYKLWTRKEALAKATGEGVYFPFGEVNILRDTVIYKDDLYVFKNIEIESNYVGAVCYEVSNK